MKTKLILFCALAVAALTASGMERPSIDRLAVESGVVAWIAAWNTARPDARPELLKPLYSPHVRTTLSGETKGNWAEYEASLIDFGTRFSKVTAGSPVDLRVHVSGTEAVSTFTLRPRLTAADGHEEEATTRVRLVWQREEAFWRIAEQQIDCSAKARPDAVVAR